MSEKPYQFPPFSSPLEKTDDVDVGWRDEKILQLQQDPEVVVRKLDTHVNFYGREKKEAATIAKKEFDSLRDAYDIPVAAEYVVVGKKESDAIIYAITNKVHEDAIDYDEQQYKISLLIEKILSYYRNKLATYDTLTESTDYFLSDIHQRAQYVYGHTAQDPEPKFHLVDIDPQYISNSPLSMGNIIFAFCDYFLDDYVNWAKQNGQSLENIRRSMLNIVRLLKEIHETQDRRSPSFLIDRIEQRLEDVFSM